MHHMVDTLAPQRRPPTEATQSEPAHGTAQNSVLGVLGVKWLLRRSNLGSTQQPRLHPSPRRQSAKRFTHPTICVP
eukprot:5949325-Prymnesium_polylepis.1